MFAIFVLTVHIVLYLLLLPVRRGLATRARASPCLLLTYVIPSGNACLIYLAMRDAGYRSVRPPATSRALMREPERATHGTA